MKDRTVHELLAVPNGNWSSIAASDVSKCHPPIQELSTWSHGIAFVRWMLRRILPYPTFLLDDARAALRLGMSLESFDRAFKEQERFQIWLESALYCGMLWDFLGRRWWKVGIDSLLWDLTQEQPFGKDLIRKAIREKAPDAVFLTEENPVACVGKEYKFERIGEAEQCVRLRPDDWPLFADSAWAARTTVAADQSFLMAVEDESDRAELETESQ
jgi:hypothetical protein